MSGNAGVTLNGTAIGVGDEIGKEIGWRVFEVDRDRMKRDPGRGMQEDEGAGELENEGCESEERRKCEWDEDEECAEDQEGSRRRRKRR